MENMYFKGLDKALEDNLYIKVFQCSSKYPIVRIEKQNKETNQSVLVEYATGGTVLDAMNSASTKMVKDDDYENERMASYKSTLVDYVLDQGYALHFYKLSNDQILSTICVGLDGKHIPLKNAITEDVKSGFEILNIFLQNFDFKNYRPFFEYAEKEVAPVMEYQKILKSRKK